ncbi:MAG: hypothetical protein ACI30K_03785 [Muribaculaceae bacterium]
MIDTILQAVARMGDCHTEHLCRQARLALTPDAHTFDAEALEALSRIVYALRAMAWLGADAPLPAKDTRKIMTHLCAIATDMLKRSRSLALRAKLLYIIDMQIGNPNIMQIFDNAVSKTWRAALTATFDRYTAAADTAAATAACATTMHLIRCLISYWRNVPPEMRKPSEQYAALTAQISAAAQRLAAADTDTIDTTDTTDTTTLIADLTIVHDSIVMLKTHSLSALYEQKFKAIIQLLAQNPDAFSLNDLTSLFEASEVGYDIARQTTIYQAITRRAANDNNTPAQSLTMLSYIASYISRANIETAIAHTFSNTKGNTAQAL